MGSLSQCKCPQTSMHCSFPSLQAGGKVALICWWDQKPTLVKGFTESTGICTCHRSSASQGDQSGCHLGGLSSSAHVVLKHQLGTKGFFCLLPQGIQSCQHAQIMLPVLHTAVDDSFDLKCVVECEVTVCHSSTLQMRMAGTDTLVRISPWIAWIRLKTHTTKVFHGHLAVIKSLGPPDLFYLQTK